MIRQKPDGKENQGYVLLRRRTKLSSSFMVPTEEPELELKVTLYNINEGHNRELMEQCRILSEYASYVATVREYAKSMSTKDAVNSAVDYCIEHGILEDFLRGNRMEVVKMSIFEYNEEREKKLERAEIERMIAEEAAEAKKQAEEAKNRAEDAEQEVEVLKDENQRLKLEIKQLRGE